ncbi:MAG: trypsin-like peptidase domain-containing protein, partial [Candidatus Nitrosocosmicus sp.]|nr:trypsin-like peptidase domain-containing protein [Candidatus Nitrosocosmicus sp.]
HIITSYSVIADSQIKEVEFMDGSTYKAEIIGSDPYSDIAVLLAKGVPENKLEPVEFINNSSNVLVGEQAATIGNPFDIKGLLSDGIISGVHKAFPSTSSPYDTYAVSFPIVDTIISTVVTNPGSAGGPLFNMKGQVIGMNSGVYSSSGEYAGISIAVPSNTLKKTVPQIISTGTYKYPWLGISGFDLTSDMRTAIGLNNTNTRGVLVNAVAPGSPADLAGISIGTSEKNVNIGNNKSANTDSDIIIGIDTKPVSKIDDILNYINSKSIDDTIKLKILRNGELQNMNVTLTGRP